MVLQMLPLLQLVVILGVGPAVVSSLPVYGTKRYGRSSGYRRATPSWVPSQPPQRTQRYPLNYYEFYPYGQTYPDDRYYYHGQDSYPLYYPRTSKYEVYQAVLPYYYQDGAYGDYGYYGYDRERDVPEELVQDAEREEREESQPIGHEMLYETDGDDGAEENIDNVKAAFLQNLIMSQMYRDALDKYYDQQYRYSDYYGYDPYASSRAMAWRGRDLEEEEEDLPEYEEEDEEVKELKDLTKPHRDQEHNNYYGDAGADGSYARHDKDEKDNHWFQKSSFRNQKNENAKKYDQYLSRGGGKRAAGEMKTMDRRPVIRMPAVTALDAALTTAVPEVTTKGRAAVVMMGGGRGREGVRSGQKEEVMMRPATNVRRPFTGPVLEMMAKSEFERKRTPSVYDQIKHMLDVEKSMENKYDSQQIRPNTMKKRLFTNEESLTQQLSLLKQKQ